MLLVLLSPFNSIKNASAHTNDRARSLGVVMFSGSSGRMDLSGWSKSVSRIEPSRPKLPVRRRRQQPKGLPTV
jgi:hypothetical protein